MGQEKQERSLSPQKRERDQHAVVMCSRGGNEHLHTDN